MEIAELTRFRRYLHAHPELSTQESKTQVAVKKELQDLGITNIREAGGTGLLVHFKAEKPGRKIALRADMDALPIEEVNDFEHRSKNDGVSHKCGHDGHTAVMLGVAAALQKNPPEKGEVLLIFQPAEENGKGAKAILEDEVFDFAADKVFAFHNLPRFPLGKIVCKKDSFTAAAKSVIFKLKGKTAHAAEPEKGINPGWAISRILPLARELSINEPARDDFKLITLVHVNLGEKAYGISAGYGEVHLTLRSWSNEVMDQLENDLREAVSEIAREEQIQVEEEWLEIFHANDNDHEAFETIKRSAETLSLDFEECQEPFRWGEDFGLFTRRFSGAMFGVGAGVDSPALHNPDYDFPDEIIEPARDMFLEILKQEL